MKPINNIFMDWDSEVKWKRERDIKRPVRWIYGIGNSRWLFDYLKKETKRLDQIKFVTHSSWAASGRYRLESKRPPCFWFHTDLTALYYLAFMPHLSASCPVLRSWRSQRLVWMTCNVSSTSSVLWFSRPGSELACMDVCWTNEWRAVGKIYSWFRHIFQVQFSENTISVCPRTKRKEWQGPFLSCGKWKVGS